MSQTKKYAALLLGVSLLLTGCGEKTAQSPITKENTPYTLEEVAAMKTVVVEEFSDIECPACRGFAPEFEAVQKEMEGKATFRFYHFPLEQIHPLAFPSAIATECAGVLGGAAKREEYLHTAFTGQKYSSDLMMSAGKTIGLDETAFEQCIKTQQTKDIVNAHIAEAKKRGVRATPTLFINGKKIEGGMARADLKKLIEEEFTKINK